MNEFLDWAKKIVKKMSDNEDDIQRSLGWIIFSVRWMLYPINVGLIFALTIYVLQFLHDDFTFVYQVLDLWRRGVMPENISENTMVAMLGFVDTSMVANLIIMIVQSGHEIFIRRFEVDKSDKPQYLAHMDTGIMKIKVALSISSITLVQILKDFVNLESIEWNMAIHRIVIHMVALVSALIMAMIWRLSHSHDDSHSTEVKHTVPVPVPAHEEHHAH